MLFDVFTRSCLWRSFLVLVLALGWFALPPSARAVSPPPDGGYDHGNTAEGTDALHSLTTGPNNTAVGFQALFNNQNGDSNTAIGGGALHENIFGKDNTAVGLNALFLNTARGNTAVGSEALQNNMSGINNSAIGFAALFRNTGGTENTASGSGALHENTTGSTNTATGTNALFNNNGNHNTANGVGALQSNIGGAENTAMGGRALFMNTSGNFNTAIGVNALFKATGDNNVAVGDQAGENLTTGSNNIDIGAFGGSGDSRTIRIGRPDLQNSTFIAGIFGAAMSGSVVVVNSSGKLGVTTSSARFKDEIKPMNEASDTLMELKPVTFRYKKQIDPDGIPQFGLVAEEVEKLNPDLVVRDKEGKPFSVRYDAVNAMLLNEFLKEHRTVQELKKEIAQLTVTVKEQAVQIQKVSAQMELSKPAPQVVANGQ